MARLASFAAGPGWLTAATPTADIYFLNAMRDLVSAEGGVKALGPNVYGADGRFVILRYLLGAGCFNLLLVLLRKVRVGTET